MNTYPLVKIIKQGELDFDMKGAQIIKTNEPLVINEVEKPKPEGNQVLVRVAATGGVIATFIYGRADMQDLKASL